MRCSTCPVAPDEARRCLGETVSRLCQLAAARPDYRRELVRLARTAPARPSPPPGVFELDRLLPAVLRCPDRGGPLPASFQPGCGCFERTECRAGRGDPAGEVTLQDCLACVAAGGHIGPRGGGCTDA
jgi:hypothetical protein